jgi:hypothetical protein
MSRGSQYQKPVITTYSCKSRNHLHQAIKALVAYGSCKAGLGHTSNRMRNISNYKSIKQDVLGNRKVQLSNIRKK